MAAKATRASKAHRTVGRRIKELSKDYDPAMADVLLCLASSPDEALMVADIAERTGLSRTAAANAVTKLSPEFAPAMRLVDQSSHGWERRYSAVRLTPAGVAAVRRLLDASP